MENIKIWVAALVMMVAATGWAQDRMSQTKDSITTALKIRELKIRKQSLQQRIATEDKKRNQVIDGVTPETQEMLNDRQDSICLDLRSQLVAVELEMEEVKPTKVETQNNNMTPLLNQINALRQNQQQNTNTQQPANNSGKK